MSSPKCMEFEGEFKSLIKVWLKILATLCYCYFISSKLPKGIFRFLSLTPVFYLFTILPLQLSSVLQISITSFFITWLTNFKLLLFTIDLGPLSSSSSPKSSLPLFLTIACFPIRNPQKQTYPSMQNPSKLHLLLPIKTLLFGISLVALNDHKQKLHPKIVLGLYCTLIYLMLDVILGISNLLVNATLGIELEFPSNDPYFSTSLRDFWGRRWNLMVTYLLRHTVYNPVRSVLCGPVLGPWWASVVGLIASFLVSGLMHELLFYYVTRVSPTWEVTCFFLLHGVCVAVEFGVVKWLGDKWRLHWVVSLPITLAFVVVTASWLFFPPLLRSGADERSIKEFNSLIDCVVGKS
ncbi:probable long-chain-alcohol O-fatty-acyltransferase 5 [Lotus japonicus]|uniref:probable long-chain-alcohol O-fatty-acyltransferase 5 n=1 Tax=Lotus japonicus TaxID=34305 RepID=UPI0025895529|nr:probable long-chain-alcohol O-fatty-acyltransferase 5 [Lotus japonicus]